MNSHIVSSNNKNSIFNNKLDSAKRHVLTVITIWVDAVYWHTIQIITRFLQLK